MTKSKSRLCPECGVEATKEGGKYSCNNPACLVISFRADNRGNYYCATRSADAKPEYERSGGGNDLSSAMSEERIVQKRREKKK